MADFAQGLDPGALVLTGAILSFAISPFVAPVYNLPIFLFGVLVNESSDAVQSLRLATAFLSGSILLDIIWFTANDQNGFIKFLTIILWILKFPTSFTFWSALRQRGSQFNLGADISGPTVWSMPGGFTSSGRQGYQVVDDEPPRGPAPPPKQANIVSPIPQPALGVQPGIQSSNYQSA